MTPIGEVMGCIVQHVGWQGWAGCGYWSNGYRGAQTTTFGGYQPYIDSVRHGYDTALQRLSNEAKLLGADGVIDVRISVSSLGVENHEFVALGSAVRLGNGRTGTGNIPSDLATPFLTDLPGADVAKLMLNGWMPMSIVYGIALAIRHDDWATQVQAGSWVNTEISGFTQLINNVRHEARHVLATQAAHKGAQGVLLNRSTMRVWEQEPAEQHRDHLAEAQMFGTGIVQFSRPGVQASPTTLTFLSLK